MLAAKVFLILNAFKDLLRYAIIRIMRAYFDSLDQRHPTFWKLLMHPLIARFGLASLKTVQSHSAGVARVQTLRELS